VTVDEFELILNSHDQVLAKFSAKWCGPCKAMEPGLQQLEQEQSSLHVVRVDVEDDANLAAKYGIRAMPTLILFQMGEPVKTQVGALSLPQLRQFVESFVGLEHKEKFNTLPNANPS